MIHEHVKHSYALTASNPSFIGSERHNKMKEELFARMQKHARGDNDLKQIEEQKLNEMKKLQHVLDTKEGFETAIKTERELIEKFNENEKRLAAADNDLAKKRIQARRARNAELRASLMQMEEEIKLKDATYDKQLESGKKVENLQNRHSQKAKELESLQTTFVDLEEKKDQLQMELMNKTQEVKDVIGGINDMVKKIMLSSSLDIAEFPRFDILDFHKKSDLIKEYKVSLAVISLSMV